MNLINDPWIPVRKKAGEVVRIAPWQVAEGGGEAYVELAAPRPDFNGALIQFLIGLLQTACPPKNTGKWREWMKKPPKPEELKKAFGPFVDAFNLDGDGPRFMQDLALKTKDLELNGIGVLLIETPGGNTLKKNTDHFIKRAQSVKRMCESCAAIALWTLQTNAPAGGQGHRTGLRGGGPLSTVVLQGDFWTTIWANVLEEKDFSSKGGNLEKKEEVDVFPWLGKTRTSERGQETTPEDVHPLHQYWAMPRRVRIEFQTGKGFCDLCGQESVVGCAGYFTKNYGLNYGGAWRHPLTPYTSSQKDPMPLPFHLHDGVGYRHWLGLVQIQTDTRYTFQPARVVERFKEMQSENGDDFRLWAFGYDMDNMKARCWREGEMPVMMVQVSIKNEYERYAGALVLAAKELRRQLRKSLRDALFSKDADVSEDGLIMANLLWERTEADFYGYLDRLRKDLTDDKDTQPLRESWRKILADSAEEIFDEVTQNGIFEAVEPGRVARAWKQLKWDLNGKNIRQILELPVEEKVKVK
jgi:CRISPR system Cascade subunit CasA